jgi:hypothetical protein
MIDAINKFIGGLLTLTLTIVSWVLWLTLALVVIAAVIAIGSAIGPMWIAIILLILIWLK